MSRTETPEERIRSLAKKSSIGASDAAQLLAAVKTEPVPAGRRFDPFTHLSGLTGAGIGFAASACAAATSHLGHVRYNGMLDVGKAHEVTWRTAGLDQVGAFLIPAAVFSIIGYAVARRGRPVDMLSTVGLARVPQLLMTLPFALIGTTDGPTLSIVGWLLVGIVLVGMAAQIYLLVIGFRTATGLTGNRLVGGVVGAFVAAEIASKVFLSLV